MPPRPCWMVGCRSSGMARAEGDEAESIRQEPECEEGGSARPRLYFLLFFPPSLLSFRLFLSFLCSAAWGEQGRVAPV